MKQWLRVIAVSSAVFCGVAAAASASASKDFELKGITIGMPEAKFKSRFPHAVCVEASQPKNGKKTCFIRGFTVAGKAVESMSVSFFDGKLGMLLLTWKERPNGGALERALTQKFGEPKTHDDFFGWVLPSATIHVDQDETLELIIFVTSPISDAWGDKREAAAMEDI